MAPLGTVLLDALEALSVTFCSTSDCTNIDTASPLLDHASAVESAAGGLLRDLKTHPSPIPESILFSHVDVVHGLLIHARSCCDAYLGVQRTTGFAIVEKVYISLIPVLRLLRNVCANGPNIQRKVQELVPELLQTILDTTQLVQLREERDSDDGRRVSDEKCEAVSSTWDESIREKYIKTALQTTGNALVQHSEGQATLWKQCFPHQFEALLQSVPPSCTDLVCMVVYNCVVARADHLHALTSDPGGWRVCALILERSAPREDTITARAAQTEEVSQRGQHPEWAGYLMVHIVRAAGGDGEATPFVSLYNGLAQLVATPLPGAHDAADGDTADGGDAAADESMCTGGVPKPAAAEPAHRADVRRTVDMIPRGDLGKLSLLKWAWGHVREGLDAQDASGNTHAPPVVLPFGSATTQFLVERFRLLSYLGRDQAWWREPSSRGPAGVLATVIPLLGDLVLLCGAAAQDALHRHNALESAVELLGALTTWAPVHATPSATSPLETGFGIGRDVVRLIALQIFRHKPSQNALRTLEGIPLLLQHFMYDDNNPWCREWATVAVRNACEGNAENQRVLAAMEKAPSDVANSAELEKYGMEVTVDRESGKLRARKKPPQ
eukprot:m.1099879 g.1099879  ORF g.1099879 m.1099879 type:complete len:613 (-) comp24318_c1_seq1:222-2060(-)